VKRILVSLLALLPAIGAGALAAAPDPYQIYSRARAAWASQPYPQYVSYTIVVTVDEKGVLKAKHYHAMYDSTHDRPYVDGVSEEERADPHVPTGVGMSVDPKRQYQTLFKKRVGRPEDAVDYLGVPMLTPNYSFGIVSYMPNVVSQDVDQNALVREIRREFNDPMPAERAEEPAGSNAPKEIGHVVTSTRDYAITYDGTESVDGFSVYHLSLHPTHAPDRLRLREIWIDTQTYATRALVTNGNFANASTPWLVKFAIVDGVEYIASEAAATPVKVGPHVYDRATISFEDIAQAQQPRYMWKPVLTTRNLLVEPSDR